MPSQRLGACGGSRTPQPACAASYAGNAKGWVASFSWQQGQINSRFPDLNIDNPSGGQDAGAACFANQAVDIVRRRLGFTAGQQPAFWDRFVPRNFSYLVMVDGGYLGENLPDPAVACPEDGAARVWQQHVQDPLAGVAATGDPDPSASAGFKWFLPFWSSYQTIPYA